MAGNLEQPRNVNPEWIASIARKVIERLRAANQTEFSTDQAIEARGSTPAHTPDVNIVQEKLITVATIAQLPSHSEITIRSDAVVTPAAKDEATDRGIVLRADDPIRKTNNTTEQNNQGNGWIRDLDAGRREAAVAQLRRRGIDPTDVQIVLSDQPAADVHEYVSVKRERAVMINHIDDVDRFASELDPTVWVLDMKRLNLVAAVNIVARIVQRRSK